MGNLFMGPKPRSYPLTMFRVRPERLESLYLAPTFRTGSGNNFARRETSKASPILYPRISQVNGQFRLHLQ